MDFINLPQRVKIRMKVYKQINLGTLRNEKIYHILSYIVHHYLIFIQLVHWIMSQFYVQIIPCAFPASNFVMDTTIVVTTWTKV